MDTIVRASGRVFTTSGITHAIIVRDMVSVYPVDYHQVTLTGEEATCIIEAMEKAGFVWSGDTMINPRRVTLVEKHQQNVRIYLEGADRILYQPANIVDKLFPALETPAKPKRTKKEVE